VKNAFRVVEGGLQERFLKSRAKVQIYGGGFANGKTAAAVVKALQLAMDYPGSNGLIARSTYPKLNDTIRKEFMKWCPKHWIKSFPMSVNASNTCTLQNGTTINFRYIAQQGKNFEATTSNLLSATYDWIIVDQLEDPEIVHKDFLDLLGRLRGMAPYTGEDASMPRTGPRWFIATTNPTANWVYRKLVKPLHDHQKDLFNDDLLCETDEKGKPLFKDGKPVPIIDLYEGSTYSNVENLEEDYIKTLEASYKGQMRDRFLYGKWASYEGLVFPDFDLNTHVLPHSTVETYFWEVARTAEITILEGYDYGLAVPSCYIYGFVDTAGNVFLMDGIYDPEMQLEAQFEQIRRMRDYYGGLHSERIMADPDIFRRKPGGRKIVGFTIADMFMEEGLYCERGNNDIDTGILKVTQYLYPQKHHLHPITGNYGAPYLFVSDRLTWFIDEITGYFWKRDQSGDITEKPQDKNNHAMDVTRYIFSWRPKISVVLASTTTKKVLGLRRWAEMDIPDKYKSARYH